MKTPHKYPSMNELKQLVENAPKVSKSKSDKDFLEQKGLKLKDLAQSIRIAMVGSSVSPAIFDVLEIIGYNEVLKRIQNLLSKQKES